MAGAEVGVMQINSAFRQLLAVALHNRVSADTAATIKSMLSTNSGLLLMWQQPVMWQIWYVRRAKMTKACHELG